MHSTCPHISTNFGGVDHELLYTRQDRIIPHGVNEHAWTEAEARAVQDLKEHKKMILDAYRIEARQTKAKKRERVRALTDRALTLQKEIRKLSDRSDDSDSSSTSTVDLSMTAHEKELNEKKLNEKETERKSRSRTNNNRISRPKKEREKQKKEKKTKRKKKKKKRRERGERLAILL